MKISLLKPFLKQLETKKELALFAIVSKDDEERKLRLKDLLDALAVKESFELVKIELLEDRDLALMEEEILTSSLFYTQKVLVVTGSEKQLLQKAFIFSRMPASTLVIFLLEALSDKFYSPLKEHLLVLDLKEEKPWLLKDRLADGVAEWFQLEKKRIPFPLIKDIVEKVGADELRLRQFCWNLVSFVGEKEEITAQDVFLCLTDKQKISSWQLVDKLMLGEKMVSSNDFESGIDGLGLIAQIRFKIQQLLKKMANPQEPFPKVMAKYEAVYSKIAPGFFTDLSSSLLELEFCLKNGFKDTPFLVDMLYAQLTQLRQKHTQ
jgi:hypothetical protein